MLHKHLTEHDEGGSYYYHHSLRTAFPKHELVCTGVQTGESLPADTDTWRGEWDVDDGPDLNNTELDIKTHRVSPITLNHGEQSASDVDVSESDRNRDVVMKEVFSYEHSNAGHLLKVSDNSYLKDNSGTNECTDNKLVSYDTLNFSQNNLQIVDEDRIVKNHASKRKKKMTCTNTDHSAAKQNKTTTNLKHCNRPSSEVNKDKLLKTVSNSDGSDQGCYRCQVCDREFRVMTSLSFHIETVHYDTYPDKCPDCFLIYKNSEEASSHHCETARQLYHVCHQCPKPICFRWSQSMRNHLQKEHGGKMPYTCSQCNLKFVSEYDLNCHMSGHDPSLLSCRVCKKTMSTYQKLKSHIVSHTKTRICEHCGKCYTNRHSFKHHHQSCLRKFVCKLCNKVLSSKQLLTCHMRLHTGQKPFICELCGQAFRTNGGLWSHNKFIHLKVKNKKCQYCDKSFVNNCTLRRHEQVHMKIRPFACEFCNKVCSTKCNLDVHMRQHNGDKPYSCSLCGTAFAHNVSRKNHEAKCTYKPGE